MKSFISFVSGFGALGGLVIIGTLLF